MRPKNIPIVYYFIAENDKAKKELSEFIDRTEGISLLTMSDESFFIQNIFKNTPKA